MDPSERKVRARRLAQAQAGRITFAQLLAVGLSAQEIKNWIRHGTLIRTRPRVYALGYVRSDVPALIWEAILYAGPGGYLTGASGAHQRELIAYPPRQIVVGTPRDCKSLPGLKVLPRRPPYRELHNGIPVAPVPELMLELAASADFNLVRKALANLDYRRQFDIASLRAACRRGRRGSGRLRRVLEHHLPQLAYTNGPLEEAFLFLLETCHLPLPLFNVRIHGILVDAYWRELGLVVELDGKGNHGTSAQSRRDANYETTLKRHGLTVIRLSYEDVHARQHRTLAMLAGHGVRRV